MFVKYPKIHSLGKDETTGILNGTCIIQEKVDGANVSIWLEGGEIKCASRNQELIDTEFSGFVPFAKSHEGIKSFFSTYPNARLYGEWLINHTITYPSTAYRHLYLFDITLDDKFQPQLWVEEIASQIGLKYPQIFAKIENPEKAQLQEFVGKSNIGPKGEGIVIKNLDFVNRFGDLCYAKIVADDFKESIGLVPKESSKSSDVYWETYVAGKYCTLARVQKIMNKLQPEINEKLDLKHIPRITNTCYHDLITEEMWEIQGKAERLTFGKLKKLCLTKFTEIYKAVLAENRANS